MTDDGFREFVELRYTELLRTAFLLTGRVEAAEDLVQSALLSIMRRWGKIAEPMPYLRRVMVNQRTNLWRRFASRELLVGVLPERGRADGAAARAERDELMTALGTLPPRMRAVVVLRYWEDLSEAETAEILGTSIGTVKSHASRGLARLREVLSHVPDQRHDGGPVAMAGSGS